MYGSFTNLVTRHVRNGVGRESMKRKKIALLECSTRRRTNYTRIFDLPRREMRARVRVPGRKNKKKRENNEISLGISFLYFAPPSLLPPRPYF